jgi:thymidylate synthase
LQRNPYPLPTFILPENITEDSILTGKIEYDQFKLDGYQYHPKISVDVAV